ncbi:MAG: hypothetical protein HOJ86_01240 [Acidimicrobiaceae bacterium]|nr:hypothetical protein [Acidimicrobiaceae bacterium]
MPDTEDPIEMPDPGAEVDSASTAEEGSAPDRNDAEARTEASVELRGRRSAFFRERSDSVSPTAGMEAPSGGRWTDAEADQQIRTFLVRLAGDRQLVHRDDPVELLQENDLLLLFGPEEETAFADLALRFPDETVTRWATLLSGGDRTEAFGPRSRAERRDEASLVREFQIGMRKRAMGGILLLGVLVLVGFGARALLENEPEDRSDRSLRFSGSTITDIDGEPVLRIEGGPPVAEPTLIAAADRVVAVLRGDGPPENRIQLDVPDVELPVRPGLLMATVFEHRGGQVALVGPEDWWIGACVRVTVATDSLRPLDVVVHESKEGACPDGLGGRAARVTCVGPAVLMLGVDIPQGGVELDEGGLGWAETIRFGIEAAPGTASKWEVLSVRGAITVAGASGTREISVPAFGGAPGDVVSVEIGGAIEECTLT